MGECRNQDILMIPVGYVIIVTTSLRVDATQGEIDALGDVMTNEQCAQVGINVSPVAPITPGAVRVAVMTNGKLRIQMTSNFRTSKDGSGLNVYPHVERGLIQLMYNI